MKELPPDATERCPFHRCDMDAGKCPECGTTIEDLREREDELRVDAAKEL